MGAGVGGGGFVPDDRELPVRVSGLARGRMGGGVLNHVLEENGIND